MIFLPRRQNIHFYEADNTGREILRLGSRWNVCIRFDGRTSVRIHNERRGEPRICTGLEEKFSEYTITGNNMLH